MPPIHTILTLSLILLLSASTPVSASAFNTSLPDLQTISHGVDEVAPAVTNATALAFQKAQVLLTTYSNTLRVIAIPTGLLVAFFGYFLLAPVLFLAAFVSGGSLCFVAVSAVLGEETPAAVWLSIAAMLLGGAMLGFLALRALNIGMFAVGAALGVVLASAFKATLIAKAYPANPHLAFIIAAVVFGLIFGLLATCLQKQMLIFSTAYAGSCACMFGIGHFAGHFPTTEDISDVEAGHVNAWLLFYILMTIAIGTSGMFFQFWLGRNKPMPRHAPNDRRRRAMLRQYIDDDWSEQDDEWMDEHYRERMPLPPRKYGHPYEHPANYRPDLQTPLPTSEHVKVEMESQDSTPQRLSWNSVRSAVNIFEPRPVEEVVDHPVVKQSADSHDVEIQIDDIGAEPARAVEMNGARHTEVDVDAEEQPISSDSPQGGDMVEKGVEKNLAIQDIDTGELDEKPSDTKQ